MTPEEKEKMRQQYKVYKTLPDDMPVWSESCPLREGGLCWHYKNKTDRCSNPECPLGKVGDD